MKLYKKLQLSRETIRSLSTTRLRTIAGGGREPLPSNIDTACCDPDTQLDCPSGHEPD